MSCRAVVVAAALLAWVAPGAAAQVAVTGVIPKTANVRLLRVGSSPTGQLRAGGDTLQPGDQVETVGPDTTTLVELRCTRVANTYRLKAPFRVLADVPASDSICHVNLLSGRADVIADSPSRTTVGGVPLGSRGTQYALTVGRDASGALVREVAVYEGAVTLAVTRRPVGERARGDTVVLPEGVAGRLAPDSWQRIPLAPIELERSAAAYARFDVQAARAANPALDTVATFAQLKQLHLEVLTRPTDTLQRVALAKRQLALKVSDQAGYNLKRARVTDEAAMRRYNVDVQAVERDAVLKSWILRARVEGAAIRARPDADASAAATRVDAARAQPAAGAARMRTEAVRAQPAVAAAAVAAAPVDRDLALITGGDPATAIRNVEGRLASGGGTSRDHYVLALAYERTGAASTARLHALRARELNATDRRLSADEARELDALLARIRA